MTCCLEYMGSEVAARQTVSSSTPGSTIIPLLTPEQRDRISVILVSPRNPLNIGAVARAMANFGFSHLTVVAPYEPHWREARSAIGAPELLANAFEVTTLAEAVRNCTLVLGTGTVTHRKPEQPIIRLDELAPVVSRELENAGTISIVFGPEKHGLTREDLSFCHNLVEIPTDSRQPSMNLGQAAAVCLYELAIRCFPNDEKPSASAPPKMLRTTSGNLDVLADLIQQVMLASNYSPRNMQAANRHDLRLMLRRLNLTPADQRRILGLFRRILRRL
jgi:TrmH family RNA methyltransferase